MVSAIYNYTDAAEAFDKLAHNDGSIAKVLLSFE